MKVEKRQLKKFANRMSRNTKLNFQLLQTCLNCADKKEVSSFECGKARGHSKEKKKKQDIMYYVTQKNIYLLEFIVTTPRVVKI